MVLSSRDRRYVTVEMVWLGPSLERRRLRFSFQFNDVKDRDWLSPAPLFCAGGRRRRLSSGRPLWCQSILSDFFTPPGSLRNLAQKSLRAAEGLPSQSVAIRLRLGNLAALGGKIKRPESPLNSVPQGLAPSEERLSSGRSA